MRINKWSLKEICFDLFTNSLNQFFKKSMKAILEDLYVDLGAWRVQKTTESDYQNKGGYHFSILSLK